MRYKLNRYERTKKIIQTNKDSKVQLTNLQAYKQQLNEINGQTTQTYKGA